MTGVYLSLRVYFYQGLHHKYGKYLSTYIKNKSEHIRDFLAESNKIRDDLLIEIDLGDEGQLAKVHSLGTIVAKYYDASNIPSTEDLVRDVNYFLDIYNFILDNYNEKTDISVDEWIEVLSNKDVIDCKMYSILQIMNTFKNKSALSSQIAEKRKELGFDDEKSYNSTIVHNSRRVKEYLNKKAIIGEDGKEIFWMRFFYGKNKKEGFEFKLKKELIEALETVDRDISDEGEDCMSSENYDSFYDYLMENEYLFDKEIIENYLLSLKVKPFAILTGNSGTGKTKLSQLFAQYLNSNIVDYEQKNFGSKKFTASVKVGKSGINKGWAIPRTDSVNLIPKMKCEEPFPVLIDGVPAKGKINFNVRFFYQPKEELVNHLNELAEKDPNQRITLELDAPFENSNDDENHQNSLNKDSNEYISFKTNDSRINNDFFGLSDNFVCEVLGLDKCGEMDIYFDGQKSRERFWARTQARSFDKDLINHLKSLDNLSDLEIKINKEDLLNTLRNPNPIEETDISFERRIGAHLNWCLPKNSFEKFLYVKNSSSWRVIVDGIEAIVEFYMYSVCFTISDDELRNHFNNKDLNDIIEFKADLSTIEFYCNISDLFEKFGNDVNDDVSSDNSNYKIIPVGANWTENRHIVGYYNVITNEYQSTPAYDLIKAANNSAEPYFLILDEMNLSHVERYFADFLSAIESGEKIPLYGEEELTLPQNLFIIGTVNVDETTYMFSPKVLDRANVIEFETYSASDYMNDNINLSSPSGNIEYLENPLAGKEIREYGIDELREIFSDVTIDDEPFWDLLSYEINSFQNILSKSGFDFGFRVINEIVRFMAVAWEYEGKKPEFANWTRYFDACIKQKMLPKLHGSEKIIGETLEELSKSCSDSIVGTEDMVKYPESFKKLDEMKKILRKQRYVSFIN